MSASHPVVADSSAASVSAREQAAAIKSERARLQGEVANTASTTPYQRSNFILSGPCADRIFNGLKPRRTREKPHGSHPLLDHACVSRSHAAGNDRFVAALASS